SLPGTIVYGDLVDGEGKVRDTPRSDAPKPPAETNSRRNACGTYSADHENGAGAAWRVHDNRANNQTQCTQAPIVIASYLLLANGVILCCARWLGALETRWRFARCSPRDLLRA